MLGCEEAELVGRDIREFTHPDDRRSPPSVGEGSFVAEYEKRYLRKDGSTLWASVSLSVVRNLRGVPEYLIGMVTDISARKAAEEQLLRRAHYDALTDLPNRVLCFDRLSQAIAQAGRKHWNAGVLFLDLDRFKVVNDTLGHTSGDAVLRLAAQRLQECVRAGDTVARVGGDEFVVVLAELASPQDGAIVAQKIVDAMAQPVRFDGKEIFITPSIGIATFPADGKDGEALVKNADAAMLRAKQGGRNSFKFYAASMNERALEKLQLETDLRRALERNEFFLHYQPKVSLAGGQVTGVEALLRWNRPGHGLVSPAQFVPVLEDCGLIVPVGDWIVDAACAQVRAWRDAGLAPVQVAVNLAAKQFLHHDIGAVIDAALARHGIPGSLLQIEITESDAMAAPEQVSAVLAGLRRHGVGVAIDDFGTGYSSLGYLKRFPLDTLKLDRSFVTGLPADQDDVSIALAVIGMAHSLGLKVVAEGVEKAEQRDFLAAHGCDEMQGYLYSRPLPAGECAKFLAPAQLEAAA
jgi:diguanylate cyclase (GGDEF)-like protein